MIRRGPIRDRGTVCPARYRLSAIVGNKFTALGVLVLINLILFAAFNVFVIRQSSRAPQEVVVFPHDRVVEVEGQGIPKVIYVVGRSWNKEMNSWSLLNPGYRVEFYNDVRCSDFVEENYPQYTFTFNHLKGVRRFDFFRYLIVYHYGGVYADSDITCLQPINEWGLKNDTTFFTGMECVGCNDIGVQAIQWTFASTKGHPILEHVIKNVVSNSFKAPSFFNVYGRFNKVIHMTGPSAFTDGINYFLMDKGTCDPSVNLVKGYVVCNSISPAGWASGVQVLPWYRFGAAKRGDMPNKPRGTDGEAFIKHGYKGSWVGKE